MTTGVQLTNPKQQRSTSMRTHLRTKLALSPANAEGKAVKVREQLDIERIMSAGEGGGEGMVSICGGALGAMILLLSFSELPCHCSEGHVCLILMRLHEHISTNMVHCFADQIIPSSVQLQTVETTQMLNANRFKRDNIHLL